MGVKKAGSRYNMRYANDEERSTSSWSIMAVVPSCGVIVRRFRKLPG
jgi:hypothetical protein